MDINKIYYEHYKLKKLSTNLFKFTKNKTERKKSYFLYLNIDKLTELPYDNNELSINDLESYEFK